MLNSTENNFATNLLAHGRKVRNFSQNKCGPLTDNIGWSLFSQNTFIYKMKIYYNRLPMQITLSPNFASFKKWIQLYSFNRNIALPVRKDNVTYIHMQHVNNDKLINCMDTS